MELIADALDQSAPTHGHLRSKLCCALYCLWARGILQDIENSFEEAVKTLREIFAENTPERAEFEFHIRPDEIHYPGGSGYVVDSLFSARWVCNAASYEEAVKNAVLLGKDTDTTACVAGGIAGLKFGLNSIPKRWRENLRGGEIYQPLLAKLLAAAENR